MAEHPACVEVQRGLTLCWDQRCVGTSAVLGPTVLGSMLRHTDPGARLNRLQLLLCVTWGRSALAVCLHPRPVESAAGPPGAGCAEGRTPRGGALSSAILYVAIVAIWAGVLIPRWLRRDSSSSESVSDDLTTAEPDSAADEEPAPRPRRQDPAPAPRPEKRAEVRPEKRAEAQREVSAARREVPEARREVSAARREVPEASREAQRDEPRGSGRGAEHKRVLSARRRLLGMLLMLVIGSGALAFIKLAAWWVVVPPSVMLLGYMTLLREAAKADAERRELARTHAADTAAAAPPAAPPAPGPPPDAEVIDISASLGSTVPAGEEFYDQYADAKLRAVGDLALPPAS
jgi:hypothetical protein